MPPPGHGVHRYFFKLFALEQKVELGPGATKEALLDAIQKHVITGRGGVVVQTFTGDDKQSYTVSSRGDRAFSASSMSSSSGTTLIRPATKPVQYIEISYSASVSLVTSTASGASLKMLVTRASHASSGVSAAMRMSLLKDTLYVLHLCIVRVPALCLRRQSRSPFVKVTTQLLVFLDLADSWKQRNRQTGGGRPGRFFLTHCRMKWSPAHKYLRHRPTIGDGNRQTGRASPSPLPRIEGEDWGLLASSRCRTEP